MGTVVCFSSEVVCSARSPGERDGELDQRGEAKGWNACFVL